MNSPGIALFLEPEGSLLDALRERKAWLEAAMPGQAFCAHPPHCTLLFGDYRSPADWLKPLGAAIAGMLPFPVETEAWQQFPHDALADGGHTVAYRVRLTPALARLQQTAADCLAVFARPSSDAHPLARTEPFATSLKKYGFPFAGSHWIPHFTIGSPQIGPESPLLAQLMSGPVRHQFMVHKLSVWRVEGDRHERLHELALSSGPD